MEREGRCTTQINERLKAACVRGEGLFNDTRGELRRSGGIERGERGSSGCVLTPISIHRFTTHVQTKSRQKRRSSVAVLLPEKHTDLFEVIAGYRLGKHASLVLSYERQFGGDTAIQIKKHVVLAVRLKL